MKTTDLKTGADAARRGPSRRGAMKTIAGAAAALVAAPYIRPASAAPTELRALMWEAYAVRDVIGAFEEV